MPDSFFQSDKKRKRVRPGPSGSRQSDTRSSGSKSDTRARRPNPRPPQDEELSSDAEGEGGRVDIDDMDFRRQEITMSDDEAIDENETAAEKRVRLAKGYLAKVRTELQEAQGDDYDAAEIDRELIASRLQQDVDDLQGKIHLFLRDTLTTIATKFLSTGQLMTDVALTPTTLYTSTKKGTLSSYPLSTLGKGEIHGHGSHSGEILCVAASEDDKWVVTGGRDKLLGVWEGNSELKWKIGIKGHKDAVTSIALPPLSNPSHHILSGSLSRHLALHSLATLSVIDTFFGHQDSITSVSAIKPTNAVTAGSRDRTCRWWKVEEETQLVFRGGGKTERQYYEGSIDVVCALDEQHFVSGGDSGSISLWHTGKKKPIHTKALAHGVDGGARWITSLAALRGTDLFVSGSWDGEIRLWTLDPSMRSFEPAMTIPIAGFVNGMQLLSLPPGAVPLGDKEKPQIVLVAAISSEPRLGRWMTQKAKTGVLVACIQ